MKASRDPYGKGLTGICSTENDEADADAICWWHDRGNSLAVLSCWHVDPYQVFLRTRIVSQESRGYAFFKTKVGEPAFIGNLDFQEKLRGST